MGKVQRIEGVNAGVLKQCREQLGLDLNEAAQLSGMKALKLSEIESGDHLPTYRQLCKLAETYLVPAWVFLEEVIPQAFRLQETPVFRSLRRQKVKSSYRVKRLVHRLEGLREHLLDLRSVEGNAIPPFDGPLNDHGVPLPEKVRAWLGVSLEEQIAVGKEKDTFALWRKVIEEKNILVFMTRRFSHWSKMEVDMMRGLSLFHTTLPVIVVNDSDSHRAQTFTLMHELAHVLRQKTFLDTGDFEDLGSDDEEASCNRFAANLLMPPKAFKGYVRKQVRLSVVAAENSKSLEPVAGHFGVSRWAAAVQMCRLGMMKSTAFNDVKKYWELEWQESRAKRKGKFGGIRNIPKETLRQFGGLYTGAVLQAFYDKEIPLSKLCAFLSLSKVSHARELEQLL